MVYNTTPNNEPLFFADPDKPVTCFAPYPIGVDRKKDVTVSDVLPDSPAYEAGFGPHMKILAVDGHVYSAELLNESTSIKRQNLLDRSQL
jgi:predicted metalloprotease with PDZ domain